ncbi:MAG: pilus assembly protein FimT [Ramlibacter sp.]|nr:pilus assembly protein FimT [Ramlibacter sp.]
MLTWGRQRGFNLIEVVVTVSVLGILVATVAPSMADFVRSARVRTLAESTQNGLQRARSEALKRNQVVTFWLVSPNNTASPDDTCTVVSDSAAWAVSLDDPTSHCSGPDATSGLPRIVEVYGPGAAGSNIVVAGLAADAATPASSVSFNGYGQRVGAGTLANIDISTADATARRLRIQITASGGIRMCDRDILAPDPRACV